MTQLNPYIRFDGKCREAMEFYKRCLGGNLTLTTVGETPTAKQMPPEMQQKIMHANLTSDRVVLLGSDMVGAEGITGGNSFVLQLECDSEAQLKALYSKLSEDGGKTLYPPSPSFWGGTYGQLADKFGNPWILNYSANIQS
jgi:PhnB protein